MIKLNCDSPLCGSGFWTFLWFVCFCLTADQWSKTSNPTGVPTDAVHAVIAFSFFSVASWVSVRRADDE